MSGYQYSGPHITMYQVKMMFKNIDVTEKVIFIIFLMDTCNKNYCDYMLKKQKITISSIFYF